MSAISYGLEGKVVLVTGGSRGIGLDLARTLLEEKAKVIICARKKEILDAAVESLGGPGAVTAFAAHIAKEDQVEAMFQAIREKFGRLDVLINNVGMNLMTGPLSDTDYSVWQKIMDTNLNGVFLVSRAAARMMKEQDGGKIVSISSIAGRLAAPMMGIYGVGKAGVEMLTKVLAAELAPFNVQVNAVAPCMVKTDFSRPFWSNPDMEGQIVKTIPLGRLAETIDVVHPTLFLASPGSDFITGQTILVDGGATVAQSF